MAVTEQIFTKLNLRRRFCVRDCGSKFHENHTKGSDADARSQKDGQTDVVLTEAIVSVS
jgi:hypothetical protein